jgi:hypothetical protein
MPHTARIAFNSALLVRRGQKRSLLRPNIPQGLKAPRSLCSLCGTAKAVPSHKVRARTASNSGALRTLSDSCADSVSRVTVESTAPSSIGPGHVPTCIATLIFLARWQPCLTVTMTDVTSTPLFWLIRSSYSPEGSEKAKNPSSPVTHAAAGTAFS